MKIDILVEEIAIALYENIFFYFFYFYFLHISLTIHVHYIL